MALPAEVIEIGITDVELSSAGVTISRPVAWLFRPLQPIAPETTAVHHITEDEIPVGTPPCTTERLRDCATSSGSSPRQTLSWLPIASSSASSLQMRSLTLLLGYAPTKLHYMSGRKPPSTVITFSASGVD